MSDAESTHTRDDDRGAAAPRQRSGGKHDADLHGHVHRHGGRDHRHPHHHTERGTGLPRPTAPPRTDRAAAPAAGHEHAHPLAFERFTYVCSPVHDLDPRAKIAAALLLILGTVLGPPPRPAEFALLAGLLVSVTLIARLPVGAILVRTFVVIPVAAGIALFAPLAQVEGGWNVQAVASAYADGWLLSWAIISKAWLGAFTVILLAATTPPPLLFKGLSSMRIPLVFTTMFTFLYRYVDVLRAQLASMRRAVASRAPELGGRRLVGLYGNLAGALFVRSYERGERIHSAMLSRGYDGTLPTAEPLTFRTADTVVVVTALLAAAALLLY